MNSVYKDRYVEIFLDLERSLIFDVWTEASEEIYDNEQIFKDFLVIWRDIIINNNIKYTLTDIRCLRYTPPPEFQESEFQEVIKEAIITQWLKKTAFIASSDFMQVLALGKGQYEYEDAIQQKKSNFFLSEEEAIQWLLNTENSNPKP